ncbi:MAG TPA: hypothetical protein VF540_07850, partial [Segetibacter sp.]
SLFHDERFIQRSKYSGLNYAFNKSNKFYVKFVRDIGIPLYKIKSDFEVAINKKEYIITTP